MKRIQNIFSFIRSQFEHPKLGWDWYVTKGWKNRKRLND